MKVVCDEARHFLLLNAILENKFSMTYSDIPVNKNILIDLAKTEESLLDRIAMISLTHEAKGLDAGPNLLKKFNKKSEEYDVLHLILREEKEHVQFGVKWFTEISSIVEPESTPKECFQSFCQRYGISYEGRLNSINKEDRIEAGFDLSWIM